MWELDCEESWAPKNWSFWTVVLEKTLESPLDCKEMQPVHSKGDQAWDFFGRNDAKAETLVLWPPHAKSWLIGKDSDAGRDWGQKEKGTTEDEMAGWHHRLDGRASEWTPGVGDGQGGLACCDSWGLQRVGHDWATQLNWVNRAQPPSYTTGELPDEQRSKHPVHCSRVSAPRMMWRGSKQALLLLLYWWTSALQWTAFGKHLWKWKILTKSLSLWI